MTVALIDNGSLEAGAHENLRAVAAAISGIVGGGPDLVQAVSWKHSDRVPGLDAWTLESFIRSRFGDGERDFVLIPFFISPQGAIGSALRRDVDRLRGSLGDFSVTVVPG